MACNSVRRAWDSVQDAFTDLWDGLSDAVQFIWKEAVLPLAGAAFSLLGIEDETVIIVDKTSNLLFDGNTIDPLENAKKKTVLANVKSGGGFFRWFITHRNQAQRDFKSYYLSGENNRYIHGLPTAEVRENRVDTLEIETAMETDIGYPITIIAIFTQVPTPEFYFREQLQASPYFYKPWNNTLTFTDSGGIPRTDYKIDDIVFNPGTNNYSINIYRAADPLITDVITVANYAKDISLVVRYHAESDPASEWYYWIYNLSSGTYPNIEPDVGIQTEMQMLPAAIIKDANGAVNIDKTTQEYLTTKKLLASIGLGIDDLIDQISSDPNYGLVQEAYINFSVAPQMTDEIISKVLWLSFHNVVVENPVGIGTGNYIATFSEQNIKNSAVWSAQNIDYDLSGTLPDGKTYHHYVQTYTYTSTKKFDSDGEPLEVEGTQLMIERATLLGTTGSPGIYDRITINDLSGMAAISRDGYTDVAVNTVESPEFTIPLSIYVISQLSAEEQLVLFEKSLRLDVYAAQLQDLDWYETSSFLSLFEGVLNVISVVSLGSASSAVEVLKRLITQYAISVLVVKIAEITGNEELAAIIGLSAMIGTGQLDISWSNLATAEGLLNASTEFANNVEIAYGVKMAGIRDEIDYINEMVEERLQEHKDALGKPKDITSEFMVALNSVDTTLYPARDAQYNFDLIYNYDRLIKDYYDLNFRTGVS